MATTLATIPAGTYVQGTQSLGPVTIPAGISQISITLDGSNYAGNGPFRLTASMERSLDNGATWDSFGSMICQQPCPLSKDGTRRVFSFNESTNPVLSPSVNKWQVRATIVISGADYVTTGGSIVVS